jgi:UPF0716 family protein affecting phage T7 exclusion
MAETCKGMMEKPFSGLVLIIPGIVFIILGVLIVIEPRIPSLRLHVVLACCLRHRDRMHRVGLSSDGAFEATGAKTSIAIADS